MTESIYDGAWRALTGRDEPWGGCARREEVERIVQFALAASPDHHAEAACICTPAIAGISDGPNVDCPQHGSDHQAEAGVQGNAKLSGNPADHQAEAPSGVAERLRGIRRDASLNADEVATIDLAIDALAARPVVDDAATARLALLESVFSELSARVEDDASSALSNGAWREVGRILAALGGDQ